MKRFNHTRHVVKAITWRIIGTIDTMMLAWIISGDPMKGLKIGALELLTKTILYYLHERLWHSFIIIHKYNSHVRHVMKSFSWRFIGSLDTTMISYIMTGNLKLSVSIAGAEVITKIILYYFHERIWHRSNFGLIKEEPVTANNNL